MMNTEKQRTIKQNKSLWKWGQMLADSFNNDGKSMQFVLSHAVERPWNKDLVIDLLYRPILKHVAGHDSTSSASTKQLIEAADILADHLAMKVDTNLPWPDRHSLAQEQKV